jgi:UDP-N-acetyl-D-glucosamine dehydrogenase
MKVSVIGQGYVGLTVALYASRHVKVTGYDVNNKLVEQLNSGISHVEGLSDMMLISALESGRYIATNNPANINDSDVIVIAVPTPLNIERKPDLSHLESACHVIGENLTKNALIINESTSFPGTVRKFIKPTIEKLAPNLHHLYSVSPERVDPGRIDWNQENTPRLYAGLNDEASQKTAEFYSLFCNRLVRVSSPEVAEAAKLFENSFRQVNIAFVNEFAQIAHALGISVRETLDAADTKPYGFMKFTPSAGVGGHCIPVDPSYLAETAKEHGVVASFIELANEVNLNMSKYIVQRVIESNGNSIFGKKVQIIGIAYKPNVADVRETPAREILNELKLHGAIVNWHDPLVKSWHGVESSPLGGEIGIIVTLHNEMLESNIASKFEYLFDTTGKVSGANQL